MRKKPTLIITGILAIAICSFLFIRSKYLVKPEKKEVIAFLEDFNINLKMSNTDTLLNYFDGKRNNKILIKLLGILSNKTGSDGKTKPLFEVALVPDEATIKAINPEITQATVPIIFVDSGNVKQRSSIQFKLRKISAGHFKIIQFDGRTFMKDFITYENTIHIKETPPKDIYSPVTLAAFKTAETLKADYDSIAAFEHYDNKTYFYVVKGTLKYFDLERTANDTTGSWKIGLVGPDLKELIPPKFDIIHNIGGTIDGLIEVENEHKRGFYDLTGKEIIPAVYDQILPLKGNENLALIRKGDDYFYLKNGLTISEKITGLKIGDMLSQIKQYGNTSTLTGQESKGFIEFNSRERNASIVFSPSYLVDWELRPQTQFFKNPLRPDLLSDEDMSEKYIISFDKQPSAGNWFTTILYSIEDNYLGGRGGLYQAKTLIMVDKKSNTIVAHEIPVDYSNDEPFDNYDDLCAESRIKPINDTLFEFKLTSVYSQTLHNDKLLSNGPTYHYLYIKNGKLTELPNHRLFGFTKYIKMDDSYLNGCYVYDSKQIDRVNPEILRYMKNEIYADYLYQFKDPKWVEVFEGRFTGFDRTIHGLKPKNTNVDDSLTLIDKYNINFINQKLNGIKSPPKVLAAK